MTTPSTPSPTGNQLHSQMRRMTRRSFALGAAASVAGLSGWWWLRNAAVEGALPWPLRRMLLWNEHLSRSLFRSTRLAPTFAPEAAREPRINGLYGLQSPLDPARWALRVESPALAAPLKLTLDDVKSLPKTEFVTDLKCVEGWSVPVQWAGATLADFAEKFKLATRSGGAPDLERGPSDAFRYVHLATPDDVYHVGLDIESALHPQTLLCYEMNGAPLTADHGAPLRLAIPVKYGYKSIKRIGTIRFLDERPGDFWAEYGYDWYAGH